MPRRALLSIALLSASWGACRPSPEEGRRSLEALQSDVAALREEVDARLASAGVASALAAPEGATILIGTRTSLVQEAVGWTARHYLNDVQLHLQPSVTVREGGDVDVRLGPLKVRAGEWQVAVAIERVEVSLGASNVRLSVADSTRFRIEALVDVHRGHGRAVVDFRWRAAAVPGLICGDFEIQDTYSGVVGPRRYTMQGYFHLEARDGRVYARPEFLQQIRVSPQPTSDSWTKIREALDRLNSPLECGLALDPGAMEDRIRDLLVTGFSFQLPASILKAVPLPASIAETVEVGGSTVGITAAPVRLALTPEWLWYAWDVQVGNGELDPDRAARDSAGR